MDTVTGGGEGGQELTRPITRAVPGGAATQGPADLPSRDMQHCFCSALGLRVAKTVRCSSVVLEAVYVELKSVLIGSPAFPSFLIIN